MRLTCEKLGTPQRSSPRHGPVRGRDGSVMCSWCIHFTTAIAEPLAAEALEHQGDRIDDGTVRIEPHLVAVVVGQTDWQPQLQRAAALR